MGFGLSDIKNIFDRPKPSASAPSTPQSAGSDIKKEMDKIYSIEPGNWYTAKPYGFKFTPKNGKSIVMFLPISPSNLTINTSFATNMIPTLYGTVEEHSDVRYFDISIEGTTGFAPKYVEPAAGDPATLSSNQRKNGRSSFSVAQGVSLGGFFSKTLGALNQIKNKASDLLDGGPKAKSGINAADSGYVAFHNLYRFLMTYKKDAAGVNGNAAKRSKHPLTFFNYKDNNEYDVVVRNFTLRKSAENPMLYYYSIQLRGYNMRTVSSGKIEEDLRQRLKNLGLDGVDGSSVLGDIKKLSGGAKGIWGAAVGGISIFGR
jgi:hypothetical protein